MFQQEKAAEIGNAHEEHGEDEDERQEDELLERLSCVSIHETHQIYMEQFAKKLREWRRSHSTSSDEYKLLTEAYRLWKMVCVQSVCMFDLCPTISDNAMWDALV